jgi:hypothetical protein
MEPWVGVDQGGPVRAEESDGGLAIWTGLGHKRNYLEACMCDAAIALPGGDGTVSEVTSSLSLDRPVAFLGDWRADIDLDALDLSSVLKKIVERTRRRFGNPNSTDGINVLIAEDTLLHALKHLPPYRYFDLCEAEAVAEWIESVVPGPAPFSGEFPRLAGLEKVARDYDRWIDQF